MFGSRRPPAAPAPVMPLVHAEPVAIANPDTPALARERVLRGWIGRTLQGHSGTVIDYDRGDPAHSYERVAVGMPQPSSAYARIGLADQNRLPNPEVYDTGTTDQVLTAYQAAMLARIAR